MTALERRGPAATSFERVPCPLCGGEGRVLAVHRTSVTSQARVLDHPSALLQCSCCAHLHSAISGLALDAYYRDSYDATLADEGLDELVTLADGTVQPRTQVDSAQALRALEGLQPSQARVLEVGAGQGRVCARLARVHRFTGMHAQDVSPRYEEPLRARLGADRVTIGALPDGPFDAALSVFSLEHDPTPQRTLRAIHERLVIGGRLFVAVPNPETNVGDLACADHTHHYSSARLEALLADCGFRVCSMDGQAAFGTLYVTAERVHRADAPTTAAERLEQATRIAAPYRQLSGRLAQLDSELADAPTYLYGAGFYASLVRGHLGRPIAGLFDSNPLKQGLIRLGATVLAPPPADRRVAGNVILCMSPQAAAPLLPTLRAQFTRVITW